MGILIGEGVRNALHVRDPVSGEVLTLYFRMPTPEERAGFAIAQFERTGKEVRMRTTEARQEYGLKILEGFPDGTFEKQNGEGKRIPAFSSDSQSPFFNTVWKELALKHGAHLIELLAVHVFDGTRIVPEQELTEKN